MGAEVDLYTAKDLRSAQLAQRFVAVTPTAGTGVVGHAAPTTFDEAKPYFLLFNGNAPGGRFIYPQHLKFLVTVVSTGGTGSKYTHTMDTGNRRTSDGTALVLACTNMATGGNTNAVIHVGAVVASAATANRRLMGNFTPRGAVVENVWDEYAFTWGGTDASPQCGSNTGASAQMNINMRLPPVAIPPQCSYLITQWKASQSVGPTLEVFFDYLEA